MKIIPFISLFVRMYLGFQAPLQAQSSLNWKSQNDIQEEKLTEAGEFSIIYFYTDWCGFCKRMDQTTFSDTSIISALNKQFQVYKFDAEYKEALEFGGKTYEFVKEGRRGHHGLAAFFLENRMGFPTIVYIDPSGRVVHRSPGYRDVPMMHLELQYVLERHYQHTDWRSFQSKN